MIRPVISSLDNNKTRINIGVVTFGVVYFLDNKINEIKIYKEEIIITGYFNAKVGNAIKGEKEEVSKSGKLSNKLILENNILYAQ